MNRRVLIIGAALLLLSAGAGFGGGVAQSHLFPIPGPVGERGIEGMSGPQGPPGPPGPRITDSDLALSGYSCIPGEIFKDTAGYPLCYLGRRVR